MKKIIFILFFVNSLFASYYPSGKISVNGASNLPLANCASVADSIKSFDHAAYLSPSHPHMSFTSRATCYHHNGIDTLVVDYTCDENYFTYSFLISTGTTCVHVAPPVCTDKVPSGWIEYPMSGNSCKSYSSLTNLEKQKFPPMSPNATSGGGAMICNNCFSPPYNSHNCLPPKILDTTIANAPRCIDNQIISQSTTDGYTQFNFKDGSAEFCNASTGTCSTLDKNGKTIPNIPINGVTYNTINDVVTHKFMSIGGIIVGAIGAAALAIGTAGFGTPAAIASLSTGGIFGGLALGGTAFTGNNPFTIPNATNDNLSSTPLKGIKINLKHMDFSKPDPSFTKTTTSNGNPISIKTKPDGSTDSVETTPTDIVVTKAKPDGSQIKYIVPKTVLTTPPVTHDLSQANNPPSNTPVTKVVTSAPTIKNDGTKVWHADVVSHGIYGFGVKTVWSQTTTIPHNTQSVTSSSSPSSSTASTTQTTTTTTNADGTKTSQTTATTKNDYSPITSRLNQILNQNTLNNRNTASIDSKLGITNNHLSNIDNGVTQTNSKLDDVNKNLTDIKNTLDTHTSNAADGLKNLDPSIVKIDTTPLKKSSDYMDNIKKNLGYLTKDVTSIKSQYTDLKKLLEGDNTRLTLSSGGCSDPNINKFASIIAPYSAVFALLTYVSFMLAIFKMIFAYFSRGE